MDCESNHSICGPAGRGRTARVGRAVSASVRASAFLLSIAAILASPSVANAAEILGHRLLFNLKVVADPWNATLPIGSPIPCSECHDLHDPNTSPLFLLSEARVGGSFATARPFCEGCHRPSDSAESTPVVLGMSLRVLPSGSSAHLDASELPCSDCHDGTGHRPQPHSNSGLTCPDCHGHDGAHAIHTDAGDARGPGGLDCGVCHDTGDYPGFASGVDADASGRIELDETDACDNCHSPGGSYNGVDSEGDSIGAKTNWDDQVYASASTIQAGKERWCVGCHDADWGTSRPDGTGALASNVGGDESAATPYGTGWGFYVTGHGATDRFPASTRWGPGMECLDCHDVTLGHIDHNQRTYSAPSDNYRVGYRLSLVGGQDPMNIPTFGQNPVADFKLCVGCHTNTEERYMDQWTRGTFANFWRDSMGNLHWMHFRLGGNYWNSDNDGASNPDNMDSGFACPACHNVHGSTLPSMVTDGVLVSTPGTTDRYPLFDFRYLPDPPDFTPLPGSTGGHRGVSNSWDTYTTSICWFDCHGSGYTRGVPVVLPPDP